MLNKYFFFFLIFNLSIYGNIFSQNTTKATKLYSEGNRLYSIGDFDSAIALFLKSLRADENFCPSIYKLGLSYKKIGFFEKYKYWHIRYFNNKCISNIDDVSYGLGLFYFNNGKVVKSKDFLLRVRDTLKFINYSKYLSHINFNLENSVDTLIDYNYIETINSFFLQYSPQYNKSLEILFYTSRKGQNLFDDENISSLSLGHNSSEDLNPFSFLNSDDNEGSPSISEDGTFMVYTSCKMNFKKNSCDIYYIRKKGNSWTIPSKLSENINSEYWDSQPFLYGDTLFFVSNRPGGSGSRDIYYSINKNNIWSKAINYPDINSINDDVSPFVRNDILYFSSNRNNSYGGYDIFLLDNLNSDNRKILNLGASINSYRDETSIYLTDKKLFLTVENKNNPNMKSEIVVGDLIKDYDIIKKYKFFRIFDEESKNEIFGKVYIKNDTSSKSFNNIEYIDEKFFQNSTILVECKGYTPKVINLVDSDTIFTYLTKLQSKIILENIYFDFDSYHLNNDSKKYLDIISDWLRASNIKEIEISGHTDNIGSEVYNLKLSEERARTVHDYLTSLPTKKIKITYKGYGSSQPISKDSNVGINRRIEFTIIKN